MAGGGGRDAGEGELVEIGRPRRRRPSVVVATIAGLAVVAIAGALVVAVADDSGGAHKTPVTTGAAEVTTHHETAASRLVAAAAETTTAAGSYHVTFRLTEKSAPKPTPTTCPPVPTVPPTVKPGEFVAGVGSSAVALCTAPSDVTVTGDAVVNTNPTAMHVTSNVSSLGPVTLVVDGSDVWEYGGADYGTNGMASGPGAPFSQFADLVEGTLGQREGALAMQSMASPNGYLGITHAAIADATPIGKGTVDGVPVTNYRVTLDPSAMPDGVTPEEAAAITQARQILAADGFVHTVQDVSVDAEGLVRHTTSVAVFSDGGTMTSDNAFSQFGCAGAVAVPGRSPGAPAGPPGCVVLPTAATR